MRATRYPLASILSFVILLMGAAPPDIRTIRSPSANVEAWFPPGSEIKGMSFPEFEDLVRAVRNKDASSATPNSLRILKARHLARWDQEILEGRSEFTIEASKSRPAVVPLEPWTPSILPRPGVENFVRSDDQGRHFFLLPKEILPQATETIVVSWELRAKPGSGGRKFSVGLANVDVGEWTLDLPVGMVPEGPAGILRGPLASPEAGRASWTFLGKMNGCELTLTPASVPNPRVHESGFWIESSTRFDVAEGLASWSQEITLTRNVPSARELIVELDAGLEPTGVVGPLVEAYRVENDVGVKSRLRISLRNPPTEARGEEKAPSPILIRGVTRVPMEGDWTVPAARGLNAVWTRGASSIRLGSSRSVVSVQTHAGRRVANPAETALDERRFEFVDETQESIATFQFRKPAPEFAVQVAGELIVDNDAPRLRSRLTCRVERGRPLFLDVDFPRSWSPDRVEIEGGVEPVRWQSEINSGGFVRVRIIAPAQDGIDRSLVVNITASSSIATGRGPLTLPRIRPVNARIDDEVWVARAESSWMLRPIQAHGLAWSEIDPFASAPPNRGLVNSSTTPISSPSLAWRWIAEDAEAIVLREKKPSSPVAKVEESVRISGGRLAVQTRLILSSREEPLSTLAFAVNESMQESEEWIVSDDHSGETLSHRPMTGAAVSKAFGEGASSARIIEFPESRHGRIALTIRHDREWKGDGAIPLVILPTSFHARNSLLILADRNVKTTVETRGGRTLDPFILGESFGREGVLSPLPKGDRDRFRVAHAFTYESTTAHVELHSHSLKPGASEGLIRDAALTTSSSTGVDELRQRLVLTITPDRASEFRFKLPNGSILERAIRDGFVVTPTQMEERFSIPLNPSSSNRNVVILILEYRTRGDSRTGATILRPERPEFSMPCLALHWEVQAPNSTTLADWGPLLIPIDPAAKKANAFRYLGLHTDFPSWSWRSTNFDATQGYRIAPEILKRFDERIAYLKSEEATIFDLLMIWDDAGVPLVIDRDALARLGIGPRTRLNLSRHSLPARSVASSLFKSLGVVVVPFGTISLITSSHEIPAQPDARNAWDLALNEASAWGSDPSDRFQTLTCWRDEWTPKAGSSESAGPTSWRFVSQGWPTSENEVRLVDHKAQVAWGWTFGLAILTLGFGTRRGKASLRIGVFLIVLSASIFVSLFAPPTAAGACAGLIGGTAGLAFFSLGGSLPGSKIWRRGGTNRRRASQRSGSSQVITATTIALATVGLSGAWTAARSQHPGEETAATQNSILAVFPYDDVKNIAKPPARVLLKLKDYDRLREHIHQSPTQRKPSPGAVDTVHRVSWRGHDAVWVDTTIQIDPSGDGLARWEFPIENAQEISATLDGMETPVRIEPGAKTASVKIERSTKDGSPRKPIPLTIRRSLSVLHDDREDRVNLTVNSLACSRIEIAAHPEKLILESLDTRGKVIAAGDARSTSARLGPVGRIELRWRRSDAKARNGSREVDGLYLWDVSDAGARVQARLTYRDPSGTSLVRLGLEKGVSVKSSALPGKADLSLEGSPERPEWVAQFDPPLPNGAVIQLDLWQPRPLEATSKSVDGFDARVFPRIEPLDVDRASGLVALRRPPSWIGRLPSVQADGPGDEEQFVRLWGDFPNDAFTLSGVTHVGSSRTAIPQPVIRTGPAPSRVRVTPKVQIAISAGRLDVDVEASLVAVRGPGSSLLVSFPKDFRTTLVTAEGLSDWAETSPGSLRLQFDGAPFPQRKLHIKGWSPMPSDPLTNLSTSRDAGLPWPQWGGQEVQPGNLTVEGPGPIQLLDRSGPAVARSSGTVGENAAMTIQRLNHLVSTGADPLRLRWDVGAARVVVRIKSQLSINPASAEWIASLQYDVTGGSLDTINLKLSSEWARNASVSLVGVDHQQVTETSRGVSYWSIRPERPIWGSQVVVIRSFLPLGPGESLGFPDLGPIGKSGGGGVDTLLRIVNMNREPIEVEGSAGLQAIANPPIPEDDVLSIGAPKSAVVSSYRVVKDRWTLRVSRNAGDGEPIPSTTESSEIEHADLLCRVSTDGAMIGSARYQLSRRHRPFLSMSFPEASQPIWAAIDGNPVPLLESNPSQWDFPLPDGAEARLDVVWKSAARRGAATGDHPVDFPQVEGLPYPALVKVLVPEGRRVFREQGKLSGLTSERSELLKAEWQCQRVMSALRNLDRSSRKDRDELVDALLTTELHLRQAARASLFDPFLSENSHETRAMMTRLASERIRNRLSSELRDESLSDEEAAAKPRASVLDNLLSLLQTPLASNPSPRIPPIPSLGIPYTFIGPLGDAAHPSRLISKEVPSQEGLGRSSLPWLLSLSAMIPLSLGFVARRRRYLKGLARVLLATITGLVVYGSGPGWPLTGCLALSVFGRWSSRQESA